MSSKNLKSYPFTITQNVTIGYLSMIIYNNISSIEDFGQMNKTQKCANNNILYNKFVLEYTHVMDLLLYSSSISATIQNILLSFYNDKLGILSEIEKNVTNKNLDLHIESYVIPQDILFCLENRERYELRSEVKSNIQSSKNSGEFIDEYLQSMCENISQSESGINILKKSSIQSFTLYGKILSVLLTDYNSHSSKNAIEYQALLQILIMIVGNDINNIYDIEDRSSAASNLVLMRNQIAHTTTIKHIDKTLSKDIPILWASVLSELSKIYPEASQYEAQLYESMSQFSDIQIETKDNSDHEIQSSEEDLTLYQNKSRDDKQIQNNKNTKYQSKIDDNFEEIISPFLSIEIIKEKINIYTSNAMDTMSAIEKLDQTIVAVQNKIFQLSNDSVENDNLALTMDKTDIVGKNKCKIMRDKIISDEKKLRNIEKKLLNDTDVLEKAVVQNIDDISLLNKNEYRSDSLYDYSNSIAIRNKKLLDLTQEYCNTSNNTLEARSVCFSICQTYIKHLFDEATKDKSNHLTKYNIIWTRYITTCDSHHNIAKYSVAQFINKYGKQYHLHNAHVFTDNVHEYIRPINEYILLLYAKNVINDHDFVKSCVLVNKYNINFFNILYTAFKNNQVSMNKIYNMMTECISDEQIDINSSNPLEVIQLLNILAKNHANNVNSVALERLKSIFNKNPHLNNDQYVEAFDGLCKIIDGYRIIREKCSDILNEQNSDMIAVNTGEINNTNHNEQNSDMIAVNTGEINNTNHNDDQI
jgi:hypothetical protein